MLLVGLVTFSYPYLRYAKFFSTLTLSSCFRILEGHHTKSTLHPGSQGPGNSDIFINQITLGMRTNQFFYQGHDNHVMHLLRRPGLRPRNTDGLPVYGSLPQRHSTDKRSHGYGSVRPVHGDSVLLDHRGHRLETAVRIRAGPRRSLWPLVVETREWCGIFRSTLSSSPLSRLPSSRSSIWDLRPLSTTSARWELWLSSRVIYAPFRAWFQVWRRATGNPLPRSKFSLGRLGYVRSILDLPALSMIHVHGYLFIITSTLRDDEYGTSKFPVSHMLRKCRRRSFC